MKSIFFKLLPYLFLGTILVFGVLQWQSGRPRDYYQFWVVGQASKSMDLTNIYGNEDRYRIGEHFYQMAVAQNASRPMLRAAQERRIIEPAGTPFLYGIFLLFSSGRFERDYAAFRLVSLFTIILSIIVLCHLFKYPKPFIPILVLMLTELFNPFLRDMLEGNVNQLQTGGIVVILWLRSKSNRIWNNSLAGFLLGLFVMFKPNLGLILILLLGGDLITRPKKSGLRLMGGVVAGMVSGFLLPMIVFGRECTWSAWLSGSQSMVIIQKYLKRSLLGMLFGTQSMVVYSLWMLLIILVPIFILFRNRLNMRTSLSENEKRKGTLIQRLDLILIGLGICIYLLSAPLIHFHYFVLVIPVIVYILRPDRGTYLRLPRKSLDRVLLGTLIYLLFNIRVYHAGYPGEGLFLTFWPFAYLAAIALYVWQLIELKRLSRVGLPPHVPSAA